MARTKNRPGTAHSASHAATDPAPAPGTASAPDSSAAAVHAALAANPGSTVAVIADAAGAGKPAARDALLTMEKAGTATRIKGGKPGIPDTWTLTDAAQDDASPAANPEDGQGDQPGDAPARSLDGPGDDEAADEDEDAVPGEQDDKAVPDIGDLQDPGDGDAPREEDAPADADGEHGYAPDPALVTEINERIGQIKAAADAAPTVLAGGGNLRAALAGLNEIAEQTAQARRSLKAAIGGRKAPAVQPGRLRDKVLAHLDEHPDKEFTPHEIHKVLNHSSGAIANALDTLVKLGEAELASDKPRRFRRAAKSAAVAPEADGADGAEDDGTKLAGAA